MSQQRRVATRTGAANNKIRKILHCLSLFPEGVTPKTISRETGLNVNTVKAILPKIAGIKKIARGFYKVVEQGDIPILPTELTDWNFHNCILSVSSGNALVRESYAEYDLGLVRVIVGVSTKGKCTLRLSSDYPLNVSSIVLVAGFFQMWLLNHANFIVNMDEILVSTIEFNKDYSNLRLDGARCITVDNLVTQFKVYQKKRGLRLEHKTKVPFGVQNIVDMLSQNPNSVEQHVKLEQQKEQLEKLTVATQKNSEILWNLIDVMKKKRGDN